MAGDQDPKQAGKAQAAITKTVRVVTQPGGKDVDWERSVRSAPLSAHSP